MDGEMNSLEKNAVTFVNLLTPGHFQEARSWLAEGCTYDYAGQLLKGEEIIKAFSDNHDNASKKIQIDYFDATVNKTEGNKVFVGVQDKVTVNGQNHFYTDCLGITMNELLGPGSIEKIEHHPIAEERTKLKSFLDSVGIEL
jgi:hypothetical protein